VGAGDETGVVKKNFLAVRGIEHHEGEALILHASLDRPLHPALRDLARFLGCHSLLFWEN
jgi:hypothetical protein